MSQRLTRTLAGITCVVAGGGTAVLAFLGISSTILLAAAIAAGSGFYLVATRSREATEPKADAAPLSDATRKRVLRIKSPAPPVLHPGTGQPIGPQDLAPL